MAQNIFQIPTAASTHLPKREIENSTNSDLIKLASLLKTNKDIPQLEVEKFDGDPSKYAKFMHTFEVTVNTADLGFKRKLLYLVQHCEHEAKRLIEFCLLLEPEDGYRRALQLLKDNNGRPNVIVRSYCNKIIKGPHIKPEDSKGLSNLAHLLEECSVTLKQLNCEGDLNNFSTIASVVKRLPFSMQTRWLRTASEVERQGIDPTFSKLVKFVRDEAEIANSAYANTVYHRSKASSSFFTTTNFNQHKVAACIVITRINLKAVLNLVNCLCLKREISCAKIACAIIVSNEVISLNSAEQTRLVMFLVVD